MIVGTSQHRSRLVKWARAIELRTVAARETQT